MQLSRLQDAELTGKRVLLRAGFDVSIEGGKVTDATRIEAIVPTMRHILTAGASLVIMAHQGRPKGRPLPEFSQKPLVPVLEKLLKTTVRFAESCVGADTEKLVKALKPGEVVLLENLRFHEGEKKNESAFASQLAALGEVYVNDAFTNCHREHASMVGVPALLPAYAGLQLQSEIENLSTVTEDPRPPVTLIISGAKMETKVPVIERFLRSGDDILLGGCIANTFIAARGFDVGQSRYEAQFMEKAQEIMLESDKEDCAFVHVPRDVVVASQASAQATALDLPLEDIEGDMHIFDVGRVSVQRYVDIIKKAGTIVWNGPLGLYEYEPFSGATALIADAVAAATKRGVTTLIGGGDTLDFHERYGVPLDRYTFVSTGGGAMLEFISGRPLKAIEILRAP